MRGDLQDGADGEGEDLELGQRIASKLSAGSKQNGPPKEPTVWINSSLYSDRCPHAYTSGKSLCAALHDAR